MSETGAQKQLSRYALGVLLFNVFVILWGAFVRASGSGAGCGKHWPLCDGEVVPTAPDIKRVIEFTHRATSGLDGLLVIALVVLSFRLFPRGSSTRFFAAISLALTVLEGALGAGLVLLEHTAENKSDARIVSISLHLANTLALLAALTLCWQHARGPRVRALPDAALRRLVYAGGALLVLVGVTGAVTALGDTLYPSKSLTEGMRADLSPLAATAIRLRMLHPLLAVVTAGVLAKLSATAAQRLQGGDAKWAKALRHIVFSQVAFGVLNMLLLVPTWAQLVHLALADAVWIVFVVLATRLFWRPDPQLTC